MINNTVPIHYHNIICKDFTSLSSYYKQKSIRNIFLNNFHYIQELHSNGKLSDDTLKSIQMMLLCSTHYLGYTLFECEYCGAQHAIHCTCKSRLCSKCGVKYAKERAAHVSSISLDVPHRHIVFTIPDCLRYGFLKDKHLLQLLFLASRNTVVALANKSYLNKQRRIAKKNNTVFKYNSKYLFKDEASLKRIAAISALHTFGRDLKWNPHIHMLIAEVYYDPVNDKLINMSHFDFNFLRKTFQYQLISLLKPYLSKKFCDKLFNDHPNGFYVYAKSEPHSYDDDNSNAFPNSKSQNIEKCIHYAFRYIGRPAMAESRILEYNDDDNTVEWFYHPHEDEHDTVIVKDDAIAFIRKILLHLPMKNFKMARYYGLYSNACSNLLSHVHVLLGKNHLKVSKKDRKKYKHFLHDNLSYRNLLIATSSIDPLLCSCGHTMTYVKTFHPFDNYTGKKVMIDYAYRKKCINEMRNMPISRRCSFLGTRGIAFQETGSVDVN